MNKPPKRPPAKNVALKPKSNVKSRIREFLMARVGHVVTRQEIQEAAKDPVTGKTPENWHQRLSELRVDEGFDILSWRDRQQLKPGQYVLKSAKPTRVAKPRSYLSAAERAQLFDRDGYTCQWPDCKLRSDDIDPVGGGTVVLTADHVSPHSLAGGSWTGTLSDWQTLCARHQQDKKNFVDDRTGRKNLRELVKAAGEAEKRQLFEDLTAYFAKDH